MIITTQAQLDAALKKDPNGTFDIEESVKISVSVSGTNAPTFRISGRASFSVVAYDSSAPRVAAYNSSTPRVEAHNSSAPRVAAQGSSAPHVVAYNSSAPRVVAQGSSTPRVVAQGSSAPHVVAYNSSAPRVVACGYAQVRLWGRTIVAKVAATVAVLLDGGATAEGGQQTTVRRETAEEWCAYYGVKIEDGVATLFKALNEDFTSPHGTSYAPGTVPVAPDWDGGEKECGGGLHFSPTPVMARDFHSEAKRYAACQVALADIAVHSGGDYPQKVKARGCCGPCVEVDEDGEPVPVKAGE